jgi:hypothetical protein
VKYALSDSGVTLYFLIKDFLLINTKNAEYTIPVKLPDGSILWSTHTCNLDIPWLPHKMTEAHTVPVLQHSPRKSTNIFCEAGCKVVFDEREYRVYKILNLSSQEAGTRRPKCGNCPSIWFQRALRKAWTCLFASRNTAPLLGHATSPGLQATQLTTYKIFHTNTSK